METESQVLMKITDHKINTTEGWENSKLQVMEELLFSKFRENEKIYFLLINMRPLNLIESTLDNFWGAGCKIGTIDPQRGNLEGEQSFGKDVNVR